MARNQKNKVGFGTVLFHAFLVFITAGAWGIVLLIWWLLAGIRK